MHCFVSILVCNHLEEEENVFALLLLPYRCYCKCSVALPYSAMACPSDGQSSISLQKDLASIIHYLTIGSTFNIYLV